MQVRKRNGDTEPVDVNKIVRAVDRCRDDLADVDPMRVATRTISGLYDGATTAELDRLSIQTAAEMIGEEPQYSRLAARLLAGYIDKEVRDQGVASFSQSIALGHAEGLIGDETAAFVAANARKLDVAVDPDGDRRFEYFGLRTVYDRYLLRHPTTRLVIETPQYFLLRVACGLSQTPGEAIGFYRLMSSLAYLPSSPDAVQLRHPAHPDVVAATCVDSPARRPRLDLRRATRQVAKLSKFAGGIGIAFSRVRSRGALIRGTNGQSNGIVPFLRTLDSSVAAVNQGGRRKGAACVYLEPWHPDVEEFLELRDNTGEDARRTHNLNLANWVPDEFMRRVEADDDVVAVRPRPRCPSCPTCGARRSTRPTARPRTTGRVRAAGAGARALRPDDAHARPDRQRLDDVQGRRQPHLQPDRATPRRHRGPPVQPVHRDHRGLQRRRDRGVQPRLDQPRPRTCADGGVDWERLRATVAHRGAVPRPGHRHQLLPDAEAAASNPRWRPVGLGLMGLQDVFFALRLPFDSAEARGAVDPDRRGDLPDRARGVAPTWPQRHGPHPAYAETRAAAGHAAARPVGRRRPPRPSAGRRCATRIAEHGLRNSLLIAIAPTATIASIAGCYECIEPQVSNLFKRETLSGEFLQVNPHLVRELKARGLWTRRGARARSSGPRARCRASPSSPTTCGELFRTAWELPQRALIDMAAARAPFIDQSQSLNLFIAGADDRQALLDVPLRLEGRAEDHLLPALAPGHPDPADDRRPTAPSHRTTP